MLSRSLRGESTVPFLGWLLASLTTAFSAHALIDWTGTWLGGGAVWHADAYAAHAHVAIVPIAQLTVMVLASLLLAIATRAVAHRSKADCVQALAGELRGIRLSPAIGLVACGGLAILIAMELLEQYVAFGHPGAVAEAFGGNVFVGASIVGLVAATFTTTALRVIGSFVAATAATALLIVSWVIARFDAASVAALAAAGRAWLPRDRARAPELLTPSCCGLRAPPSLL